MEPVLLSDQSYPAHHLSLWGRRMGCPVPGGGGVSKSPPNNAPLRVGT